MGAVPKKMVTVLGKRVPVIVFIYLSIVVVLVVSLLLPWISLVVAFHPEHPELSVDGSITARVYLWGKVYVACNYIINEIGGSKQEVASIDYGSATILWSFFAIIVVAIMLYVILILTELGKIKTPFLTKTTTQFYIETLAVVLLMVTAIIFVYLHNIITTGISEVGNLGALKADIFQDGRQLRDIYTHTSVSWSLSWGPGYIIFVLSTLYALAIYIDRHLFSTILNLSTYWRLRGHFVILSYYLMGFPIAEAVVGQYYYTWTPLLTIIYTREGVGVEWANPSFTIMFIIIAIMAIVYILGVTVFPLKYVIKAEPFITLALPDEEILRRHRILPITLQWKRNIDILLSILSFLAIAIFYVGLVRGLGRLLIIIYVIEKTGILWTTPTALILTVCIIAQVVLILKPTK